VINLNSEINVVNGITLVTLQGSPAKVTFLSEVLNTIADSGINIDMISMAPTHSAITSLSFTISDDDMVKMLPITAEIKKSMGISSIISSINHKISIYDPNMKNTPGIAADFFNALNSTEADIRLITTSEVEISILVSDADYDTVIDVINSKYGK
jgi:aspartokinase